ncbi:MAG: efflux RND transporter periplasmic adaptor subunit [Hyphomicrobiaceae bacterium]|nr:efflux RND transporter periplasmic adaptor subunit [Hyphomicrobiaceae bacterium]
MKRVIGSVSTRSCFGIAGVLLALLAPGPLAAQRAQAPAPVFVAPARMETVIDRLEALGTLQANEQVTITAQVTKIISKLNFDDGQRVKRGYVLAEMTSAEEQAMLVEAEALAKEAREQLDRIAPLAQRGVSAEATLAERRRDAESTAARVDMMRSKLADLRILAPFDGVLGLRRISVGALVEPGTVITTIDDDSRMKLDFTVPATVLQRLALGQKVEARSNAFPGREFVGELAAIDSRVDPVTRSVSVRAILPNPDGTLRAGLLMTVEVLEEARQALVVPEKALIPRGRQSYVYVVDHKSNAPKVEQREVVLGSRYEGRVEIRSGLEAEEHVIIDGTLRVSPGQTVEIKAIGKGGEPLVDLLKDGRNPS